MFLLSDPVGDVCVTCSAFVHPKLTAGSIYPQLQEQKVFRICLIVGSQAENGLLHYK